MKKMKENINNNTKESKKYKNYYIKKNKTQSIKAKPA